MRRAWATHSKAKWRNYKYGAQCRRAGGRRAAKVAREEMTENPAESRLGSLCSETDGEVPISGTDCR